MIALAGQSPPGVGGQLLAGIQIIGPLTLRLTVDLLPIAGAQRVQRLRRHGGKAQRAVCFGGDTGQAERRSLRSAGEKVINLSVRVAHADVERIAAQGVLGGKIIAPHIDYAGGVIAAAIGLVGKTLTQSGNGRRVNGGICEHMVSFRLIANLNQNQTPDAGGWAADRRWPAPARCLPARWEPAPTGGRSQAAWPAPARPKHRPVPRRASGSHPARR